MGLRVIYVMFWPLSLEVAPWFLLGEFWWEPEYAPETLNSELLYTRHFELHKMSSSDEISPFSFQGLTVKAIQKSF